MAIRADITATNAWFAGEDKMLSFEVLDIDGATPLDVSDDTLEWILRKRVSDADPPTLSKTLGSGLTVTGAWTNTRQTNTQRVLVAIAATDTATLAPWTYAHALKRTDPGSETVYAFGSAVLQQAAAH